MTSEANEKDEDEKLQIDLNLKQLCLLNFALTYLMNDLDTHTIDMSDDVSKLQQYLIEQFALSLTRTNLKK
jgi:hypothetical protein